MRIMVLAVAVLGMVGCDMLAMPTQAGGEVFAPVREVGVSGDGVTWIAGFSASDCPSGLSFDPSGQHLTMGAWHDVGTVDIDAIVDGLGVDVTDWGFSDHEFVTASTDADASPRVLVTDAYYGGGAASVLELEGEGTREDVFADEYVVQATFDGSAIARLRSSASDGRLCEVVLANGTYSTDSEVCAGARHLAVGDGTAFIAGYEGLFIVDPSGTQRIADYSEKAVWDAESRRAIVALDGSVAGIDTTGKTRWSVPASVEDMAALDGGRVVLLVHGDDGRDELRFVHGETGRQVRSPIGLPQRGQFLAASADATRVAVVMGQQTHVFQVEI